MKPDKSFSAKEILAFLLGAALLLFGATMILGVLIQWFDHSSTSSFGTDLTVFILLGLLPAEGALLLIRRTFRASRRRRDGAFESALFRLAASKQNKITAVEVAESMSLPIADARSLLDRYCEKGIARLEISDSGVKVYWFWELVSEEEKKTAELI